MLKLFLKLLKWSILGGIAWFSFQLKTPLIFKLRTFEVWITLLPLGAYLYYYFKHRKNKWHWEGLLTLNMVALILVNVVYREFEIRHVRSQVENAPTELKRRLGRHIILGFRQDQEIEPLLKAGLIGGLFITSYQSFGLTKEALKAKIKHWRELSPLPIVITTDQEGGGVSRLSPPLTQTPYLKEQTPDKALEMGRVHGKELAEVGVDVNFAPVVDLRPLLPPQGWTVSTSLHQRAISHVPGRVIDTAGAYLKGLEEYKIHGTLKHFPGLGDVNVDTHLFTGQVMHKQAELDASDWRPFKALAKNPHWLMVGHILLPEIDPQWIAPLSSEVLQGILRDKWRFDGVLVTDDMCMGPIFKRGVGESAIKALNSGMDYLLISYDGLQYYRVMHHLLKAYKNESLNHEQLDKSKARIKTSLGY